MREPYYHEAVLDSGTAGSIKVLESQELATIWPVASLLGQHMRFLNLKQSETTYLPEAEPDYCKCDPSYRKL